MIEKYINPFTDFGFKKLFGEESDKELLKDFLSELIPDKGRIVELQKARQKYFKDRSLYYATFAVQEQAQRGDWDSEPKAVYTYPSWTSCLTTTETRASSGTTSNS